MGKLVIEVDKSLAKKLLDFTEKHGSLNKKLREAFDQAIRWNKYPKERPSVEGKCLLRLKDEDLTVADWNGESFDGYDDTDIAEWCDILRIQEGAVQ